jgi:hypothetical protein
MPSEVAEAAEDGKGVTRAARERLTVAPRISSDQVIV